MEIILAVGFVALSALGIYLVHRDKKAKKAEEERKAREEWNPVKKPEQAATPMIQKIKPTAKDFSPESVLQRYLTTTHEKVPAQYDYYAYYQAEFDCLLNSIPVANITLRDEKVLRQAASGSPFEQTTNLTKRTPAKKVKNFVVIDTETTGLKVAGNDVIEVTAIKFEDFIPVEMFSTLLKPRKPVPAEVTAINGITDAMVQERPTFAQIRTSLQEFIAGLPIVAHNAAFDIKFLHASGLEFPGKTIFFDTLALSRRRVLEYDGSQLDSYKLADVCAECSIYFEGAHRSGADALATGLLFIEIVKRTHEVDSVYEIA